MDPHAQLHRLDQLPQEVPVFPLPGVLLLPRGHLPLHVFETRYMNMVEDSFKSDRMIGIVQPSDLSVSLAASDVPLYETGCAGRITSFEEIPDNRFLITLTGTCRFNILGELPLTRGYRRVRPDFSPFEGDLTPAESLGLDREKLKAMLADYFQIEGLSCDWEMIDGTEDEKLITCLSMICPFEAGEKQALLEAASGKTRAGLFMAMLEMAVRGGAGSTSSH